MPLIIVSIPEFYTQKRLKSIFKHLYISKLCPCFGRRIGPY
jgi:hypothetical protein